MHKVIKPFSASIRYGNDHYFDPLKNHLAIIYKSLIDLNPNFSATNIKKLSKTLATYVELCYTMLRIMLVKLYLEVLVLRKIHGTIFFTHRPSGRLTQKEVYQFKDGKVKKYGK